LQEGREADAMTDVHGKAMNTLLRMIVPIRREFGRSLDVQHFLHDLEYRKEIIEQSLQSQDTRLRDYAKYVQQLLGSPRTAAEPPAAPNAAPTTAAAAPTSVIESAFASTEAPPSTVIEPKSREDELREQILRKYTTGLR
jgi:hypothetical protein